MKHDRLSEEQINNNEPMPQEKPEQPDTQKPSACAEELDVCRKELETYKDRLARVSADLQNFRNRTEREKISWTQDKQIDLIRQLLPVVDNFERALATTPRQELTPALANWFNGLELTYKDLTKFFAEAGVKEIDCSTVFDPHVHEALTYIQTPEKESGLIVDVIQKGYLLGEKIIRPAQVCVAK